MLPFAAGATSAARDPKPTVNVPRPFAWDGWTFEISQAGLLVRILSEYFKHQVDNRPRYASYRNPDAFLAYTEMIAVV